MASVLLIEDDPQARKLLETMLTRLGHDVRAAADGASGLRLFHDRRADLVVTDIVMPEREGLEVIREIREEAPGVKIVAISGGGRKLSGEDCLEDAAHFGADRTLLKPFGPQQLGEVVGDLLRGF